MIPGGNLALQRPERLALNPVYINLQVVRGSDAYEKERNLPAKKYAAEPRVHYQGHRELETLRAADDLRRPLRSAEQERRAPELDRGERMGQALPCIAS